jgi:predicted ester cyclase
VSVGKRQEEERVMSAENVASSRRFIEEAFNQGNLGVIDEIVAEGFVDHDPLAGDQDAAAAKQSIAGYRQAFPDLHCEIEEMIDAGDTVIYRWSAQGTFENEILGLQPTHEKGNPVRGITIDRYEGDKCVESWSEWDTLTFMRDLGAVPAGAAAS